MFKWRNRSDDGASAASAAGLDPEAWTGATRDQWTVPGVYCETAGWRLSDAADTRMSWVGAFGGTMALTRDEVPAWTGGIDLEAVRLKHRADAVERHGGLVSAEFVEMASGALALEVVTKYSHGMGYGFEGRLLIDEAPLAYSLVLAVNEAETGVRESIVSGLRMQLGEIDLAALISGPVDPATGARPIPGMKLDPYDAAFDGQATYSASDDPRLDDLLQTHPLAVIRSTLRRAGSTWECASRATGTAARQPLPYSSGPKVVLTDNFFQKLHAMVKKH